MKKRRRFCSIVLSIVFVATMVCTTNPAVVKAVEENRWDGVDFEYAIDESIMTEDTEGPEITSDYDCSAQEDTVEINLVVDFSSEFAELYKQSIQDALDESVEDLVNELVLTNNELKEDLISDLISEIEEVDVEAMFVEEGDRTLMEIPLSDIQVEIGDEEYAVSEEGVIEDMFIEDLNDVSSSSDDESLEIVLSGVTDQPIEFNVNDTDNGKALNLTLSFEDFAEGVAEMSDQMSEGTAQKVTNVYPAKVNVGSYVGQGAGRTKVYFNTNIVGCNKHDKNLNSINTVQFALGNSDCAKSVKLGLAALASSQASVKAYYANSIFCVIEGMTSATGDNVQNAYCNGKRKAGSHVNCSWFNGIGHSERFHYHKYS